MAQRERVHLYEDVENVGVARHVRLHVTKLFRDGNAFIILQNETTSQILGKTNEVIGGAKPIIRMVRYPTSVCIMLIIRKDKGAFHSMEAYDAITTKYNRLNETSILHK